MGPEIRRRRVIRIWLPIGLAVSVVAVLLSAEAMIVFRYGEGFFRCPSPEWQQSARSEMEAIVPIEEVQYVSVSDCDGQGAVSYRAERGDVVAHADAIVGRAKSRGWQPVGADGSRRCLFKEVDGTVSYLSVATGQYRSVPYVGATMLTHPAWCAIDTVVALVGR